MTTGRDQGPAREPKLLQSGVLSTKANMDPKYVFGEDAEVENRRDTGYNLNPSTVPQHNAPAFKQIPVEVTGRTVNEPTLERRSGDMKFSSGPREG